MFVEISDGHNSAAIKVLASSVVALDTPNTRLLLKKKTPSGTFSTMPRFFYAESPLLTNVETIHCCIKSFPKRICCGRDA